jgi:hypothetical protein
MLKKIKSLSGKIIPYNQELHYLSKLNQIGQQINLYPIVESSAQNQKVLFGHSFSIFAPCFVHDRILAYALRLRGIQILPVYCDQVQSTECNVYGGVWGGQNFKENCNNCLNCSQELWQDNHFTPLKLSSYLRDDDHRNINHQVSQLNQETWVDFTEDNLPFGLWAKDILVNNFVVGDYRLIPNQYYLGVNHIKNLLLLKVAYSRILEIWQPDKVIANDSYYGMWAILEKLSKKYQIPFYSHWLGGKNDAWCYAYNDAAMNLDFSKPWAAFSSLSLTEQQITKVKNWLDGRSQGKEMILDTSSLSKFKSDEFDITMINFDKPTALLASNVIWDLAALNKQVVFDDMIDWIVETINWFKEHPQFQLIIKPHPAELHPSIPATEERVETALKQRAIELSSNIILLSPKVKLTVYDLFPLIKTCLVHTTTVGIEVAAFGLPVITTGKSPYRGFGFTLDPVTPQEYFKNIEMILSSQSLPSFDNQLDLAYKFILFYHYHYYTKINIMDYKWGELPTLKIQSLADILPGKNKYLDYIIDSIIQGLPIISEDRWMPEN